MDLGVVIAIGVVALALGAVIGWLFASREGAAAKQTVESLRMQLNSVSSERDEARANLDTSSRELAALQADARNFDQRMKDLAESKDALIAQFREIGDQLLEKAHKDFLEKAGERFNAADKASDFVPLFAGEGQVAVVANGDLSVLASHQERLGLADRYFTGGGVTHMSDRVGAG